MAALLPNRAPPAKNVRVDTRATTQAATRPEASSTTANVPAGGSWKNDHVVATTPATSPPRTAAATDARDRNWESARRRIPLMSPVAARASSVGGTNDADWGASAWNKAA